MEIDLEHKPGAVQFRKCDPPCKVCVRITLLTEGKVYVVRRAHRPRPFSKYPGWVYIHNDLGKGAMYCATHFHPVARIDQEMQALCTAYLGADEL